MWMDLMIAKLILHLDLGVHQPIKAACIYLAFIQLAWAKTQYYDVLSDFGAGAQSLLDKTVMALGNLGFLPQFSYFPVQYMDAEGQLAVFSFPPLNSNITICRVQKWQFSGYWCSIYGSSSSLSTKFCPRTWSWGFWLSAFPKLHANGRLLAWRSYREIICECCLSGEEWLKFRCLCKPDMLARPALSCSCKPAIWPFVGIWHLLTRGSTLFASVTRLWP